MKDISKEKVIEVESQEQWFPVIIKEESVVRHSEGSARHQERDYYHYTTLTNEKVVLYNSKTGEMKEFNNSVDSL